MKKVIATLVVMFMLSSSYSVVNAKAETNPTVSVQLKNYLKNKRKFKFKHQKMQRHLMKEFD